MKSAIICLFVHLSPTSPLSSEKRAAVKGGGGGGGQHNPDTNRGMPSIKSNSLHAINTLIILDAVACVDLGELGPGDRHKSGGVTQTVEARARINRHQCGFLREARGVPDSVSLGGWRVESEKRRMKGREWGFSFYPLRYRGERERK